MYLCIWRDTFCTLSNPRNSWLYLDLYNPGIGPVFITLVIDDQSGGYRLQKSGPLLQKSGAPFLAVELYREKIGVIRILSQAPPLKALELRR